MSRWDLITVELLEELKAAMEARLQVAKDFVGDNNTPLITLAYLERGQIIMLDLLGMLLQMMAM
jgi:hypothetical protein